MNQVFIGLDPRQMASYTALHTSISVMAKEPVSITPLIIEQLPITRTGLTPFTYSRFLVPYLMGYQGLGLFLDADMLLKHDIGELFSLMDKSKAVMVRKSPLKFEWASVMLFNCEKCTKLTPDYIQAADGLHSLTWAKDEDIGELPAEWNHLVGYDKPNDAAKLIHYTQGVPAWAETQHSEHAAPWQNFIEFACHMEPWASLMAGSVHAVHLPDGRSLPRLHPDAQ